MEAEQAMTRRLAVFSSLLAIITTACGHPMIPKSALTTQPPTLTTIPSSESSVTADIGSDGPVLGVNLYALDNYSEAQVRADGKRMLPYIRNVLHANAVDIVWNFYTTDSSSNTVEATTGTLSAANVAILTRIAKQNHLLVEYRPLIMIKSNHPWEGSIKPTDPVLWFDSYYNRELPYLRVAQRYDISEFVAATEMRGLNSSPYWREFFSRLDRVIMGSFLMPLINRTTFCQRLNCFRWLI